MAKKQASLGCLFWVALILLVLVIVLFNYKRINSVMENTGMNEYLSDLFKKEDTPSVPEEPVTQPVSIPQPEEHRNSETEETVPSPVPDIETETPEPTQLPQQEITLDEKKSPSPSSPQEYNIRNANIYFIRLKENGEIECVPVKRKVKYTTSPLTSTLRVLFSGPSVEEAGAGLHNMIPRESELKNIFMRGNTAYLDFNENFRFNIGAKAGMIAQLKQIVYTATEFINVHDVQIMIEGKVRDYLGPEGVFIGKPLARGDL